MDNLDDLMNSLFKRGTPFSYTVGPYGSKTPLVRPATTQRVVVEFAFRVGRR
jgi:hypothetical protein